MDKVSHLHAQSTPAATQTHARIQTKTSTHTRAQVPIASSAQHTHARPHAPSVEAVVGQLEGHLDDGVRVHLGLLHQLLSKALVLHDGEVDGARVRGVVVLCADDHALDDRVDVEDNAASRGEGTRLERSRAAVVRLGRQRLLDAVVDPAHAVDAHHRISRRVLAVDAREAVLKDDDLEGLVEPAASCVAGEAETRDLLHVLGRLVVENKRKQRRVDRVKRLAVARGHAAENLLGLCPNRPVLSGEDAQAVAAAQRIRGVLDCQDAPLQLLLAHKLARGCEGIHSEDVALANHNEVRGVRERLDRVALLLGHAAHAKQLCVLVHAERCLAALAGRVRLRLEMLPETQHVVGHDGSAVHLRSRLRRPELVLRGTTKVDIHGTRLAPVEVREVLPPFLKPVAVLLRALNQLLVKAFARTARPLEVVDDARRFLEVGIRHERAHGRQVLGARLLEVRHRQARQLVLVLEGPLGGLHLSVRGHGASAIQREKQPCPPMYSALI
eukprot:Opistho-1_new@44096